MASEDGVIAITVEDVVVDSTATEDDAVDKPGVRFPDQEGEAGAAPGAKQSNGRNASERPTESPSSQTHLQLNSASASSSSSTAHIPPPSPRRQHVRRDDTPPLDEKVFSSY